jgi:hypothetical protein
MIIDTLGNTCVHSSAILIYNRDIFLVFKIPSPITLFIQHLCINKKKHRKRKIHPMSSSSLFDCRPFPILKSKIKRIILTFLSEISTSNLGYLRNIGINFISNILKLSFNVTFIHVRFYLTTWTHIVKS